MKIKKIQNHVPNFFFSLYSYHNIIVDDGKTYNFKIKKKEFIF